MGFKHFIPTYTRTVTAIETEADECHLCEITIGMVHSGKQRVFTGYFCDVICNELNIHKEHVGSMYRALTHAVKELNEGGLELTINGVHKNYRESGLSENTGWGYIPESTKAVLMIDEMGGGTLLMHKNGSKELEQVLSGLTITAIIKVVNVLIEILPDDIWDVLVECQGLNWNGFPLYINMTGKYSNDELDRIRFAYSKGSILRVSGEYSILNPEDGGVSIYNPVAVSVDVKEADLLNEMFD